MSSRNERHSGGFSGVLLQVAVAGGISAATVFALMGAVLVSVVV